jgi:hypothetical protein
MGPRSRLFANRCSIFFPHSNAPHKDNDPWSALRIRDGYIAEFHRMMEKMDENQQTSLQEGLCEVFSYLHCLPASGTRVWIQRNDAAVFMTNPAFYRIQCIGKGEAGQNKVRRTCRTRKLIKGKRIFTADLMDSTLFDTDGNLRRKTDRQKRREVQKKMSAARKNYRIPPPPRTRKLRPFPMSTEKTI